MPAFRTRCRRARSSAGIIGPQLLLYREPFMGNGPSVFGYGLSLGLHFFPGDRVIHNETGRILFLQRRYADAVASFARTLAIDPEDLTAHYNLILCHRGLGDEKAAETSEKLYRRFKADEPSQALVGPYLRANVHDNNERQPIHEHGEAGGGTGIE